MTSRRPPPRPHWSSRLALAVVLVALLGAGCAEEEAPPVGDNPPGTPSLCARAANPSSAVTANRVIAYAPVNSRGASAEDWCWFFDSSLALGSPGGTFDVVSLGYDPAATSAPGGSLTLGLGRANDPADRQCVFNGAGADLAVYENVFAVAGGGRNTEVATVAVAQSSGGPWYTFPHNVSPPGSSNPDHYSGLVGVTPNAEGGDRFDLADIPNLPAGFRACYVRLTDGGTLLQDYGNTQSDLHYSGADIDAVEALNPVAVPGLTP